MDTKGFFISYTTVTFEWRSRSDKITNAMDLYSPRPAAGWPSVTSAPGPTPRSSSSPPAGWPFTFTDLRPCPNPTLVFLCVCVCVSLSVSTHRERERERGRRGDCGVCVCLCERGKESPVWDKLTDTVCHVRQPHTYDYSVLLPPLDHASPSTITRFACMPFPINKYRHHVYSNHSSGCQSLGPFLHPWYLCREADCHFDSRTATPRLEWSDLIWQCIPRLVV